MEKLFNLPYTDKLLQKYQNFCRLPGFVLLESSDKTRGRYDILSAYPYDYLAIKRDTSCLAKVYTQLQCLLPLQNSTLDLPFQGGAIGYFSYDFATALAGTSLPPQPGLQELPFVEMGFYDWAIISDHQLKKITLYAGNSRPETQAIVDEIVALWYQDTKDELFSLETPFMPLISKAEYQEAFQAIYQELQAGRCYQVNYTQPFNASYKGDVWEMYKRVVSQNPVPYSAFFRSTKAEILSFSPERFLTMTENLLLTSPIKGSARRANDSKEDQRLRDCLQTSSKNRAENVMIVDLLRNDLGKIAQPGSVQVKALCEIQSYCAVHHLVSHIQARCRENITPLQAFAACFPGGSITGAPKLESMRVIAEQERYGRGIYCGSIAYFSRHGRFDSSIAIRTLTARDETLYLAAGGGIVIDSQWEDEYRECFTKIAAIVNGGK